MQRKPFIFRPMALSLSLLVLSGHAAASDSVAYYSDNQNDRVIAFDPVEMRIRVVMEARGSGPYPIGPFPFSESTSAEIDRWIRYIWPIWKPRKASMTLISGLKAGSHPLTT